MCKGIRFIRTETQVEVSALLGSLNARPGSLGLFAKGNGEPWEDQQEKTMVSSFKR